MTKEEAEKAAATFEFPPFTAKAYDYSWPGNEHNWYLVVFDRDGVGWGLYTTHEWLDWYSEWQRYQHVSIAS